MNIKELRFIHNLLIEEEAARKALKLAAAMDLENAKESSDPFTIQAERDRLERINGEYYEAHRVLQSFEDEEWK